MTCNSFDKATAEEKEKRKDSHSAYKRREIDSLNMKNADKINAKHNPTVVPITFDLEAVLPTPFAGDSQIYYKRKLSVFNFTIHEASSLNGYCYLWDETEGNRGAAEIATCLIRYLNSLPPEVSHVSAFCDTCAGQNRNQFLAAALLHTVQTNENLYVVDVKYMESGHSYLEVDSMHNTNERARRHKNIYSPREWEVVIRGARKTGRPYEVQRLVHSDFLAVKQLAKGIMKKRSRNQKDDLVNWLSIKWFRFDKTRPYVIQYKYSVMDVEFNQISVLTGFGPQSVALQLHALYHDRIPISIAKKRDLMQLLKSEVIPCEYSCYYNELPSAGSTRDCLPEPSADELLEAEEGDYDDDQESPNTVTSDEVPHEPLSSGNDRMASAGSVKKPNRSCRMVSNKPQTSGNDHVASTSVGKKPNRGRGVVSNEHHTSGNDRVASTSVGKKTNRGRRAVSNEPQTSGNDRVASTMQ